MPVLAAARSAAGSAFANAKHTHTHTEGGGIVPAASALPGGVQRSLCAPSEGSDLCAHPRLPLAPGAPRKALL